ncbi:glycosyltransferase WbuB [Steroidobacter agaridevorans]|uniref:Glycosyltransferase WbuB n=1 Tax=Steroidobacter agaridevorans TaxID=2695856 RepID=A0A829YP40_9GAMM|nr:glycosyltransferase family 4 protein [Steroidobacter agaridevorans]GFE84246.1 glycosyltransferase WbuB [Steroidobacter agaridevorans]
MLRIVFVNRFFYPDLSATSQMLFDLACRLVEQNVEVHVVCSDRLYDDPSQQLPSQENVRGIHVHRTWTSHFGRGRLYGRAIDYGSFYVTASARLLRLLRSTDTVVAKTDPPLISIVVAAIAKVRGARLVNWLQDVFPEVASHLGANPLPAWLDSRLTKLRDYSLSMARTNVVLGMRMREHLEARNIPGERIRIIENWADGDAVTPKSVESCELRARLGIADKFVVAYSGNLGRAHEFETLLDAAERLSVDPNIVFLMIGGGAKMEQLQAAVTAKRLPNFRFLPYQPRELLSDSLAAADVHLACLLPQLEGLIVPSKFYGILAAGRPTIFIGDVDGELARIINAAGCGAAVSVGDASALVDSISRLQADRMSREQMGHRARALFVERYTVGRATRQWLEALQSV